MNYDHKLHFCILHLICFCSSLKLKLVECALEREILWGSYSTVKCLGATLHFAVLQFSLARIVGFPDSIEPTLGENAELELNQQPACFLPCQGNEHACQEEIASLLSPRNKFFYCIWVFYNSFTGNFIISSSPAHRLATNIPSVRVRN